MIYHPLPLLPMQESGGSLLRAIQNDSMPSLDLLVRESVQNSLDASLQGVAEVRVDFNIQSHNVSNILATLQGGLDEKRLWQRFQGHCTSLEVRDSHTEGLTGPMSVDELGEGQAHGNLLKLVYEVGRSRESSIAGGSWGLGKTCYFRVGIGLVFYYSRIRNGHEFQERLVACLVENEMDPDRLQPETRTGIAWWGEDGGLPITDTQRVRLALEQLGVKPFVGEETGTSIFIPFLKQELLPQAEVEEGEPGQLALPDLWWHCNVPDFITVALQRWFCARIGNRAFRSGPPLCASVNGQTVEYNKMLPIFRVLQALYNRLCPDVNRPMDYLDEANVDESSIFRREIRLNSVFQGQNLAGEVMGVALSPEQLGMSPPRNLSSPFLHVFGTDAGAPPHLPLVTFMRRHGMSVRWDAKSETRGWGGGFPGLTDGRFLVVLFSPTLQGDLVEHIRIRLRAPEATLESYLRGCEKADHHQWKDQVDFTIIERIRRKVGEQIHSFGSEPQESGQEPRIALRLARNLADLMLGPGGGRDGRGLPVPAAPPPSKGKRMSPQKRSPIFEINETNHGDGFVKIKWRLGWGNKDGVPHRLTLGVDTEDGTVSRRRWLEDVGTEFPFLFQDVQIENFSPTGGEPHGKWSLDDESTLRIPPWADEMEDAWISGSMVIRHVGIGSDLRAVIEVDDLGGR